MPIQLQRSDVPIARKVFGTRVADWNETETSMISKQTAGLIGPRHWRRCLAMTAAATALAMSSGWAGAERSIPGDHAAAAENKSNAWRSADLASSVIGAEVQDARGQRVGRVKDIVLDPARGRIESAVVSFRGFMGLADKLFAVPWSALQPAGTGHRFVLKLANEQLNAARGVDALAARDSDSPGQRGTARPEVGPYWNARSDGRVLQWDEGSRGAAAGDAGAPRWAQ